MLAGLRGSTSGKVFAKDSEKEHGPFFCLGCKKELTLKKGRIKIHHFAHKPPFSCSRGQGETEKHRECKESIYKALLGLPNVRDVDIERDLGSAIADVFAVINNVPVAIEIQQSKLSVNEITRRTQEYHRLGINVLWLFLSEGRFNQERFSPSACEKWCHTAYYGRVYYWVTGLNIIPYHFDELKLYIEESTWYESGEQRSAGGYYRSAKRYRTPKAGSLVSLVHHFKPNYRPSFTGGSVHVPECRLFVDTQVKWWSK